MSARNGARRPARPTAGVTAAPTLAKVARRPSLPRGADRADMAVDANCTASLVVAAFSKAILGDGLDGLEYLATPIHDQQRAVQRGDLRDAEALLMGHALGLNAIYTELVQVARQNLNLNTSSLDTVERLLRLGLRAQSQCRATIETLAAIKNPPTVFARQANIAHGPQQVNNLFPGPESHGRAGEPDSVPNELLEAHGERLDGGATPAARTGDPTLAPVALVHRPEDD